MAENEELDRPYPRWIYHPVHAVGGRLVESPEAEEAQVKGEKWYDTPAEFPEEALTSGSVSQECPYCKIRDERIAELEKEILELEKE